MTQEQKELLLKDLCVRLPYGVKAEKYTIRIDGEFVPLTNIEVVTAKDIISLDECPGYTIKPYLFPLSSMTEEQEEEFKNLYYRFHESAFIFNERFSYDRYSIKDIGFYPCYLQDWLNKNHFDYRGLIPMGLANDATGLNIY